jgi:hypothetical protein
MCFLFFSCEKNENSVASTLITLGDTTHMKITSIDSFITAYSSTNNRIKLDIDHDGINDYELTNFNTKGPQMTWDITADINSLNSNSFILGEITTDTLFRNESTTYATSTNNHVYCMRTVSTRCNQVTPDYTILKVRNTFRLKPFLTNEFFSINDLFETGSYEFWESSSNTYYSYQNPDTSFTVNYSQYSCFALPYHNALYFGIRINKANRSKYGWIKLINDYSSLIVLETAIQK